DVAGLHHLPLVQQGPDVAPAAGVEEAPDEVGVVDVVAVTLVGAGIAVVHEGCPAVVAARNVLRALVVQLGGDGGDLGRVARPLHQRAGAAAAATGRHRVAHRVGEVGHRHLPVLRVLIVDVAVAAALEDQRAGGG